VTSAGVPGADERRDGIPAGQDEPPAFDTSVAHVARRRAEVTRLFDGLELLPPGMVRVQEWRPDTAAEATSPAALWCGVARRP